MAAVELHRFMLRGGERALFDHLYPEQLWIERAEEIVAKSNCLAERFDIVVDDALLCAELGRMRRSTMDPKALHALLAVLKHDDVMVKECLVRPLLVDHLLRGRIAWDESIQQQARTKARALESVGSAAAFAEQLGGTAPQVELCHECRSRSDKAGTGQQLSVAASTLAGLYRRLDGSGPGVQIEENHDSVVATFVLEGTPQGVRGLVGVLAKVNLESWWAHNADRYSSTMPGSMHAVAGPLVPGQRPLRSRSSDSHADKGRERWWARHLPPPARTGQTAVWTGTEMILFGGLEAATRGWRYDPATDRWSVTSADGAPTRRTGHTAVWTGTEMIIWGGTDGNALLRTGACYDPVADTWRSSGSSWRLSPRRDHTAVWTGAEMIIWGGNASAAAAKGSREKAFSDGAGYDPVANTWTSVSVGDAPAARYHHTAVWTGTEMIVWGGLSGSSSPRDDGGIYDPQSRTWQAIPGSVLEPRSRHTAVWTGTEMIVWGGKYRYGNRSFSDGARYEPARNRWYPMATGGEAPSARLDHVAVWTGSEMIIWGGLGYEPLQSGARYDPGRDSWQRIEMDGNPGPRTGHSVVWTGTEMLVWGGVTVGEAPVNDGGRYDPEQDSWLSIGTGEGPEHRSGDTAVWTGAEMIIWGGTGVQALSTGYRYHPSLDTWEQISNSQAPEARSGHAAVWGSGQMVVWGGLSPLSGDLNSGGRYDPVTDSWSATAAEGAPSGRTDPLAVWTGSEMLVWGGRTETPPRQNLFTGARYDPVADTWQAMTTDAAPPPSAAYRAVWTGEEMLVCGSNHYLPDFELHYGGRYSPLRDTWVLISEPLIRRRMHSLVWTGTEVLIWGGYHFQMYEEINGTGEAYDPLSDSWRELPMDSAPSPRFEHRAVWTGTEMIVWGGDVSDDMISTGSRFLPETEDWLVMRSDAEVLGRAGHHALWTGSSMIVYGGEGGTGLAIYFPPSK